MASPYKQVNRLSFKENIRFYGRAKCVYSMSAAHLARKRFEIKTIILKFEKLKDCLVRCTRSSYVAMHDSIILINHFLRAKSGPF